MLSSANASLLAQVEDGGAAGGAIALFLLLLQLALVFAVLAGCWKMFTKAGKPGWAALVPIYNVIVMLQIAGRPAWWVILMFVPLVNLVVAIWVAIDLAKRFGKGVGFGLGIAFLGFICVPILGFGNSRYLPA